MTVTVQYQISTYSGKIELECDENASNDAIIAKAKKILSRNAPLPLGYESFKVKRQLEDE